LVTNKEKTAGYAELTTEAYTMFVDAFASANQRALDYSKSLWQILSRPYTATAIEAALRENVDRSNQIFSLTIDELQANGQKTAEFAERLVAHSAKLQDTYVQSLRGAIDTGVSNLKYIKDVAEKQLDDAAKRIEDLQPHEAAPVSNN
jgi:adenylosuccinate lyase